MKIDKFNIKPKITPFPVSPKGEMMDLTYEGVLNFRNRLLMLK
jgi:hypothetical protein